LYPGQYDFLPAQSDLNMSLTARYSVFFLAFRTTFRASKIA